MCSKSKVLNIVTAFVLSVSLANAESIEAKLEAGINGVTKHIRVVII